MPVYNVAAAFGRKAGATDYGYLVDQLAIKEDQLSGDGKLAPGDYDLLMAEARKIYAHPGLTPAQRSNVLVKISGYEKDKKVNRAKDSGDIARINRQMQDDYSKNVIDFSNDPQKFLKAKASGLNAKIDQLSETIDAMDAAGDDSTNHYNELTATLNDYQDTLQALDDVEQYDGKANTKSNFAAYLITNSSGEVVDMKIEKIGSKSGYIETNGVYGGLQVYGKINRKDNNKNVFLLGDKTFSAVDYLQPGPDGTFAPSKLVESSMQGGTSAFSRAPSKNIDIDPTTIRAQNSVRSGGWVEGNNGFLYQRQDDGGYKKYVNADKAKLGISDNDIMRMPESFVSGIQRNVRETIDGSAVAPVSEPMVPASTGVNSTPFNASTSSGFSQPAAPKGRPGATQPTERVGTSFTDVASGAIKSGMGYLQRLFTSSQ